MGLFGGKPPETRPVDHAGSDRLVLTQPGPTRPNAPPPKAPCVIGAKTTIQGELSGDEDILVEGTIEGEVRIVRSLMIGSGGTVRAKVHAQAVVVAGQLVGDCEVGQRMEIQATGRVTGNIRAPRIVIAEGAVFKGNSDMSPREGQASGSSGD